MDRASQDGQTQNPRIAVEGRTCWRRVLANRVALLVDGEAYFAALARALQRARRSVVILGWDIESRVRLIRDGLVPGLPSRLAPLLRDVISRRPELHVYLLPWDFSTLYLLEREPSVMTHLNLRWSDHGRLHIHWDGNHPIGACHHQKIVVVDDRIAFTGGFDLTSHRWDTPEHRPEDSRRETALGIRYGPFHDVQVAVDAGAAAALGELARRRWERATGERLAAPIVDDDPWPPELTPDLFDVQVAIARTEHDHVPSRAIREVEELFAASIAAARETIYIECQYFTSKRIGDALAEQLERERGADIVIVTTLRCNGWLEELTMGVLRARMLRRLRAADRFGRLRVYCAMADVPRHVHTEIHSKVMVIDDAFLRVGSANLTNRSMALDTECDVAIEACGEDRIRAGIRRFRDRLLGEHLGISPDQLAGAVDAHASLIAAIEALRGGSSHTLVPLDREATETADSLVPEQSIADPERPIESVRLLEYILHEEVENGATGRRPWVLLAGVLVGCALLALLWALPPFQAWLAPGRLLDWTDPLKESPLAPLIVIGAYMVGALVVFPLLLLIVYTAMVFGPVLGGAYTLLGCLAGAITMYGVGRGLGRHTVRKLTGRRLGRLTRRLARSGTVAVAAVRLFPVAPASIVSLICGAVGIRFRHFTLGTLIGVTPGVLALTLFGDQLGRTLRSPTPVEIAVACAMALAVVGVVLWIRRGFQGGRRRLPRGMMARPEAEGRPARERL